MRLCHLQRKLHHHGIDPAVKLESDSAQDARVLESQFFVNANGCFVLAVANDGDQLPATAVAARRNQLSEKGLADALSHVVMMHVDRVFQCESVGDPRAIQPGVGITDDAVLPFRNEVGQSSADNLESPPRHLET